MTRPQTPGSQAASTQAAESAELRSQVARLQQQVGQLTHAHAEQEAFAAAVAHDLRTPLSAADGFCSLLQDSLAAMPQEEARRCELYAGRVRAGLQHMGELIDALLLLSRAANADLRHESINLSNLATEVLDGLCARQPHRARQLSVQPALQAWGDRALLRQVLENLLGNAWKFSQGRAVIDIEFGQLPPAEGGAFYVCDHGVGFDMDQAARLFLPFERLHSSAEFSGNGIGLATVRRIISRHGGQVRAQATPGGGATFFFTLGDPNGSAPTALNPE